METVKINDLKKPEFEVSEIRDYGEKWKFHNHRIIVFVALGDRPGPFGDGKGTLADEFKWRFNHDHLPPKQILEAVKPTLESAGYVVISARYSVKAGCSRCPCSPGYLVKTTTYNGKRKVIWLTEKTLAEKKRAKKKREKETIRWQEEVVSAFCGGSLN